MFLRTLGWCWKATQAALAVFLWLCLLVIALVALTACAAVGTPESTSGAGCVEYRGQAAPGIIGRPYVQGMLDVHGCRCNATSEDLVRDFSHWCEGQGDVR